MIHSPNDISIVSLLRTLRLSSLLGNAGQAEAVRFLRSIGAGASFVETMRFASTYGILEADDSLDTQAVIRRFPDARLYDCAVIALAIEPQVLDALPFLQNAVGGPGHPGGVLDCRRTESAILIDFRPEVTSAQVIFSLIDIELARFGPAGRVTTLLTPLPLELATRIAAEGLHAAELTPARVLEALLSAPHA
ncbi:MAG: hypothetical protein ABI182_06125 [Candidatus Baltobacteraceae bacterium]